MSIITGSTAESEYGVTTKHEESTSGELRFRLRMRDGASYIRTECPHHSDWQNSHYHAFTRETYIVQTGWIAYALLSSSKVRTNLYRAGDIFTVEPMTIHNSYMSLNTTVHTVKHGCSIKANDWLADPTGELNRQTKNNLLTDEQVLLVSSNPPMHSEQE